jgi:hypothetical protein
MAALSDPTGVMSDWLRHFSPLFTPPTWRRVAAVSTGADLRPGRDPAEPLDPGRRGRQGRLSRRSWTGWPRRDRAPASSSSTRRPPPCSIPAAAARRPATSGRSPVTTGDGAEPFRPASSIAMRQAAASRMSGPRSTASAACSRWTATAPTRRCATPVRPGRSSSRIAGRMGGASCARSSIVTPLPWPRRACAAAPNSTASRPPSRACRRMQGDPSARRSPSRWSRTSASGSPAHAPESRRSRAGGETRLLRQPLAGAPGLSRRWPGRDGHEPGRECDPAPDPPAQEQPLRRSRRRGGELGPHRLPHRDLQDERRRSLRLSRLRPRSRRRRSSSEPQRRDHSLGLRQDIKPERIRMGPQRLR